MTWLARLARRFGLARGLALLLLVALAALRLADPHPVQELRVRVFDFFQVLHPRDATERPVVIVDIDEKSLNSIGQWPWPRTRIADMITRLTQMGALVVAFDVVFAEPDRMSPGIAADTFRDLDEATRTKLRALPSNDAMLADAFRKSRVVVGESGLPFAVAAARRRPAADRHCDNGRRPAAASCSIFPACCATCPPSSRRPAAAGFSRSAPNATASSGACRS